PLIRSLRPASMRCRRVRPRNGFAGASGHFRHRGGAPLAHSLTHRSQAAVARKLASSRSLIPSHTARKLRWLASSPPRARSYSHAILEVVEFGVPDAADLVELVDRGESAVLLAVVDDALGQHRPDAGQRLQLLERGRVQIDQT